MAKDNKYYLKCALVKSKLQSQLAAKKSQRMFLNEEINSLEEKIDDACEVTFCSLDRIPLYVRDDGYSVTGRTCGYSSNRSAQVYENVRDNSKYGLKYTGVNWLSEGYDVWNRDQALNKFFDYLLYGKR